MTSSASLKRSLLLSFTIVAAVPLLLVSIIVLYVLTVERYREVNEKNLLLAQAVSGQVESFLQQPQATVAGLVALHTADPLLTDMQIQATLDALVEDSPLFESFYLSDSAGIIRQVGLPRSRQHLRGDFLGTDLSHLPYFQQARSSRQTTWSDTFLSLETGHMSIAITSPFADHILVGNFSIARLTEFIAGLRLPEGVVVVIIDRSGAIIAHPDPVLTASQVKVGHLPPVRAAMLGQEGTARYNNDQGEHLGSAVLIHGPEWITLVSQSVEQATRPILRAANLFLLGTVAALLLAFFFSVIKARRLAAPLSGFRDRARLIADGDYNLPAISDGGSREVEELAESFSRMVTAVRTREEEVRKGQDHYRLLVETMREGLFIVDANLCLTYTNPRFIEMSGYEEKELLGRPLFDLLDSDNQRIVQERLARGRGGEKIPYELEWVCRDGTTIVTIVAPQPLFTEGGFVGSLVVVTDISLLKRSEALLQSVLIEAEAARDQVDAILRSVPHPLVVTDLHGSVLLMNREAETLSGQPQEKLAGLPFKTAFRSTELVGYLEKTLQQHTIQPPIDVELLDNGLGEVRTFKAHSAFIGGGEEDGAGLVVTLEDMTRERESDRLKSEFIAVAAHELSTPLTSIIGYAELLLGSDGDAFSAGERREFLTTILEKGFNLERIIDDLLHLGRMESGRALLLETEVCVMEELLQAIVEDYRRENSGRTFILKLSEQKTPIVIDRMRVSQVLGNLLTNALKYSAAGSSITVTGGMGGGWYSMTVSDEGIGMSADEVERVFEKFYRAHSAMSNIGGLGLGMTIVKNIVEAHHGRITIDSTPGRGTNVTVLLPLQPPS